MPRTILGIACIILVPTVGALVATGGTYALWSDSADLGQSTLTSGSTSLMVEGSTEYMVPDLDLTTLAPGRSVSAPPVSVANTGTTPMAVSVSATAITAHTLQLADFLTVAIAFGAAGSTSCDPDSAAPTRLAGATTTAAPVTVLPGEVALLCFRVGLGVDAPQSVQGGSAAFVMTVDGVQVRRP